MNINKFIYIVIALLFSNCNHSIKQNAGEHEGEEIKIFLTSYSDNYELFAEADPFVAGKKGNILSHFTRLSDFKAIDSTRVSICLIMGQDEFSQQLDLPVRKGIYSFDLQPGAAGTGSLVYRISSREGTDEIVVPSVVVYENEEAAVSEAKKTKPQNTNTIAFTKEQSWKIDFSTGIPEREPFGQVIKTTAVVQPALNEEVIVSARTSGIVNFPSANLIEGALVHAGATLFSVSGEGLAESNASLRYNEARNDYLKAGADYVRQQDLARDKIIPEKELIAARNVYENAKAKYDMLSRNFNVTGQTVTSPLSGFLTRLYVGNGQYVETGQPLIAVSRSNKLMLRADIQQKYASLTGKINSAVLRIPGEAKNYTLEELNGKVLGYGRRVNPDNFLIPVLMQINNPGGFIPGGFVEVFLKTITNETALVVPNSSLMEEQGIFFVLVQVTPELFEKREVQTGASDGMRTEIRGGLNPGERIVTRGAMMVKLAQASGVLDPHAGHVH